MSKVPLVIMLLLGLGGAAFASQKPGPVKLEAGKRYRVTVSIAPALTELELSATESAFEIAGFKNPVLLTKGEKTFVNFDAPALAFPATEVPGEPLASLSGFSPGGHTLIFERAEPLLS